VFSQSIKILYPHSDKVFPDSLWKHNPANQWLSFSQKTTDTLILQYERYPVLQHQKFFILDSSTVRQNVPLSPILINPSFALLPRPGEYITGKFSDALQKNGSISRGITVGNNQNASLQSQLNLQVLGKIAEDIEIEMAATDNSIPFQPDGTTTQLQEFDRIYITARTPYANVTAGDFQIRNYEKNYFLKYFKRLQGLHLENTYRDSSGHFKLFSGLSFAVSKGKFSRMVFYGQENNQGPYRLRGADGETFIIVLSGTERVYVDGELLQRGQDKHYIIDYNAGEITFTARMPVTKDKRIVIEFQYAERNYSRTIMEWREELQMKKSSVHFSWLNEQDNPNRPLQQELTQEQKKLLYSIGDTVSKAISPAYIKVPYSPDEILYVRKDTIVQSVQYKGIFFHKTTYSDLDTFYKVTFSQVGTGKGNYVRDASQSNGRVFKWVAPVNGKPSGDYEPVVLLVTPKKNSLFNAGATFSVTNHQLIEIQGAVSDYDRNRFSPYNRNDDRGYAANVSWNGYFPVSNNNKKGFIAKTTAERVTRFFTPFERFRTVEFERDWNRPLDGKIQDDQQYYLALTGWKNQTTEISGQGEYFSENNRYEGHRTGLNVQHNSSRISVFHQNRYLESRDTARSNYFFRHRSDVSIRIIRNVRTGYKDEYEQNIFSKPSVLASAGMNYSYRFYQWEPYLEWNDSTRLRTRLFYRKRTDQRLFPVAYDSVISLQTGGEIRINYHRNHPVFLSVQYREIKNKNKQLFSIPDQSGFFNRLEYQPVLFRGLIQAGIFAESGYGLENKKEFYYLEVNPGQGFFTWIDYNGDGIKQLNEFEPARYPDQARFIRVYIPTQNYFRILKNQLDMNVYVKPSAWKNFSKNNAWNKFIQRWEWQMIYRGQLNYQPGDESFLAFHTKKIADSLLQTANQRLRINTFFNQGHPVFGVEYSYLRQQNKQWLNFSLDNLYEEYHELKIRLTLKRVYTIFLEGKSGVKNNVSPFFPTRNYFFEYGEGELRLQFQPGTDFRISVSARQSFKINRVANPDRLHSQEYSSELRYNLRQGGSIQTRLSYVINLFQGNDRSTAAFEMMNALQKGENWLWEVGFQQNITKNLQASVFYQGRKNIQWIHTGTMEVRAFF